MSRPDQPKPNYRLFMWSGSARPAPATFADEQTVRCFGVRAAWRGEVPDTLRYWIVRWNLVCRFYFHPGMPLVYTVWIDNKLAHYSFVLPRLGRIAPMSAGDLEIGPCWTAPEFRLRGLYSSVVRQILTAHWEPSRVFWLLTREKNRASFRVAHGLGFDEVAQCRRVRRLVLPLHHFPLATREGGVTPLAESRAARDLVFERQRYNARSQRTATGPLDKELLKHGAETVPLMLREPYVEYHDLIRRHATPGMKVVDICAGDGAHSITAALAGAEAYALDIAEESLKAAERRASAVGQSLRTICANSEKLPFVDSSIDMLTCAGGLSYMDRATFMAEVMRVLRPGGIFLFVDSFDYNPIYRLNRLLHVIRGERTLSTMRRMPDPSLLRRLGELFEAVDIRYFGILVFLFPVLFRLFGAARAASLVSSADRRLARFKNFSFKIVVLARRPSPRSLVSDGAAGAAAHRRPDATASQIL